MLKIILTAFNCWGRLLWCNTCKWCSSWSLWKEKITTWGIQCKMNLDISSAPWQWQGELNTIIWGENYNLDLDISRAPWQWHWQAYVCLHWLQEGMQSAVSVTAFTKVLYICEFEWEELMWNAERWGGFYCKMNIWPQSKTICNVNDISCWGEGGKHLCILPSYLATFSSQSILPCPQNILSCLKSEYWM